MLAGLGVLFVLVGLRAWVFVLHAGAHFDSDQAVIGLMGKDLAELRAFPWFTYGRRYMLAPSAWLCAPLFALFGTSVAMLKLPLFALNLLTVSLLWLGLSRGSREALAAPASEHTPPAAPASDIAPLAADSSSVAAPATRSMILTRVVSILPFALPGVITSSRLVEMGGGNIEPFVLLVSGFLLRDRAILLGINFGFAFLNREFALVGLIALLMMDVLQGRLRARWKERALSVFVTGAIIVLGRLIARLAANYFGGVPSLSLPALNGLGGFFQQQLPVLLGTLHTELRPYAIQSDLSVGQPWVYAVAGVWFVAVLVVLIKLQPLRRSELDGMPAYLVLVGLGQSAAFLLLCPAPYNIMLIRYVLIVLLGIVGIVALALSRRGLRELTFGFVAILSLANLSDHVRMIHEFATKPPRDDIGTLAQDLVQRQVHYAIGDYWLAYHVSFLTDERVIMDASFDQRIERYQQELAGHPNEVVRIEEHCAHGTPIVRWELCEPKKKSRRHRPPTQP
jgi:hypothetical protein